MSELPAPRAQRMPRSRLLDRRVLLGAALMLASVAGGATVIGRADHRVAVWAASRDLGPGTTITATDLHTVEVVLSGAAPAYVSADRVPVGQVLTRAVHSGELLPAAGLVDPGAADVRRVTLSVPRPMTTGLRRGSVVDLYVVVTDRSGGTPGPPALVIGGATVDVLDEGGGGFGGTASQVGIGLLVPAAQVPAVVAAIASGDVYLVQVPGPGVVS